MRNLQIRVRSKHGTGFLNESEAWCKDPDSRDVYCLNEGKIWKIKEEEPELIADLSSEGYLKEGSKCVGFCSIPDQQCLLMGLNSGELLQVGVLSLGEVEEVGAVESGLEHLSLSQDLEIITLVTGDLKLILMTRDYTPLSESSIHQEGFGEGEFVNAGWGKKETQFHGSEGKEARVVKIETAELTAADDQKVRLNWRGDGEMLVVSYVTPGENPVRRLRVFDRRGILFSTSELCPGLEQALSWKPSGNLIATTVRKQNKHFVAFFEKNGLQHGEFNLRTEMDVKELEWNCDSSVLLVWGQKDTNNYLQFWTIGNYHWYLKQTLTLDQVRNPRWDMEDPNLFQFLTTDGEKEYISSLTFSWATDTSLGRTEKDLSLVASIDGNCLKVTPMREAIIPPPMSAYELHFDSQILHVMFPFADESALGKNKTETLDENDKNETLERLCRDSNNIAVLTSTKLFIFSVSNGSEGEDKSGIVRISGAGGTGYNVKTSRHRLIHTLETGLKEELSNFIWFRNYLVASTDHPTPALVFFKVEEGRLVESSRIVVESSIYLVAGGNTNLVVLLQDSTLLTLQADGCLTPSFQFPRLCSHLIQTKHGVLGLNQSFKLYLNEKEIASNITSMFLHSHFLLATTMDHRLIAVPAEDLGSSNLKWEDAGSRRVERGSRLVTAVPFHSRTVLQMPRGNLESIQPRSLTVLLVQNLLNSSRFQDAFLLARRQRINLNLLVDHNIQHFMKNIDKFVEQVCVAEHMNIFLAELIEEDVCTTMYSAQYPDRKPENIKVESGKVVKVCTAVREELERQDGTELKEKNILPILGTLVSSGNNLEEALDRIKKLRDGGKDGLCDEALRYILYSVDVNLLFNVALGTYDFQLVLMVAEKSQQDPKEYLPILNRYKAMPENYMKYSIDKQLKRFESALVNISRCEDRFEECLALVQENRMYKQALKLFLPGSEQFKSICGAYATYLESKRYYLESSYMYEKAGQLDQAVNLADQAGSWERAGTLARRSGWRQDRLVELWKKMAVRLEEQNRGLESAAVWRDWLQDSEEAIAVLSRSRSWDESIRLCRDQDRSDLLETHVLPALKERKLVLESTLETTQEKITSQVERLLQVRLVRSKVADEDDEDEERNLEDADMFSETTSVGGSVATTTKSKSTLATRQSSRSKSSKNRRKQDRKMYSTREGSQYEDLGLIAELHEAISAVPGLVLEVSTILRGLLELEQEDGLKELQERTECLLKLCEDVKPKIWPGQEPVKERFGPESTVEDIIRGTAPSTEYRSPLELMEPYLRFAPRFSINPYWKLEIL